jgi:hypothetical protein
VKLPATTICELDNILQIINDAIDPILTILPESEVTDIEASAGYVEAVEPTKQRIESDEWYPVVCTRPSLAAPVWLATPGGQPELATAEELRASKSDRLGDTYTNLVRSNAVWRYA